MADMCENILNLIGEQEDLESFYNEFQKSHIDFFSFEVSKEDITDVHNFIATDSYMKYMAYLIEKGEIDSNEDGIPNILKESIEYTESINHYRLYVPYMTRGYSLNNFIALESNFNNWYQWRLNNWGSKWDVSELYLYPDDTPTSEYHFQTAHAPTLQAIFTISEIYPEVEFRYKYTEPNSEIAGYYVIRNGETLECVIPEGIMEFRVFNQDYMNYLYEEECPECGCPLDINDIIEVLNGKHLICPNCS